jgi:hypothetical protein
MLKPQAYNGKTPRRSSRGLIEAKPVIELRSHTAQPEGLVVICRVHLCTGLLLVAALSLAACDSNTPTPTPTPVPPSTPPPPPPPPPAPAALESLTLSESSVNSQSRPTATIRLTAPAPVGNAPVSIDSSNPGAAQVPANVSVAAGQTANTFAIDTSTVRDPTAVTISARYEGVTMTAVLTVLPPTLVPQFSVASASRGNDACAITAPAGTLDCQFDASASAGFVAVYRWTLSVGSNELKLTRSEGSPVFTPLTDCTFLSGGSVASDGTVAMPVALQLEDRQGNVTSAFQRTVTLYPNGQCGY